MKMTLSEMRKSVKLTKVQVSNKVGVTPGTIGNWKIVLLLLKYFS